MNSTGVRLSKTKIVKSYDTCNVEDFKEFLSVYLSIIHNRKMEENLATTLNNWSYFEDKIIESVEEVHINKLNIYLRKCLFTYIDSKLIFDPHLDIVFNVSESDMEKIDDAFSLYYTFKDIVVEMKKPFILL